MTHSNIFFEESLRSYDYVLRLYINQYQHHEIFLKELMTQFYTVLLYHLYHGSRVIARLRPQKVNLLLQYQNLILQLNLAILFAYKTNNTKHQRLMFTIIKTKRIAIEHNQQQPSPVSFCSFLNDQRIFVLFQNNNFIVIHTKTQNQGRIVFEDTLDNKEKILDCRRIKNNVCVMVGENLTGLTLIKYVSDEEVLLGTISIQEMQFFKSLSVTAQIIPFHQHLFVLKSQLFSHNITYFTVFRENPANQYNYEVSITSYEHDPVATKPQIFKALLPSSELIFFKQNEEDEEVDWKLKFVPIDESAKKQIDLFDPLCPQHWIFDVQVRSNNQYYLFTTVRNQNTVHQIQIISVRLYQANSNYAQQTSFLFSFSTPGIPTQVIDFNTKKGYFLIKCFHHCKEGGAIYDNLLEVRSIQSGKLINSAPCNLKTIQLSPSHKQILDYCPGISPEDGWVLHIRTLISKQCLYSFLIQKSYLSESMKYNLPEVLSLLSPKTAPSQDHPT